MDAENLKVSKECQHDRVDRFAEPNSSEPDWRCAECGERFVEMGIYTELARRANVLEHRMGAISLVLRDDIEGKPIRDF